MHKWYIKANRFGAYRAEFCYKGEWVFRTPNFASKRSAINAIESAKLNMPGAPVVDKT